MFLTYKPIKLFFDFVLALIALILLSPVLLLLSLISFITNGSPVFFLQERPGLRGKPFWLIKFRTMVETRNSDGNFLPDDQRLTRFGRFLRATSLDEMPTLINVLKGDMSFVGPRPLLMRYLDRYTSDQARRHEIKPGITGWAQINGRNAISWEEKFELDVWYVDNVSFLLDVKILCRTFVKVLLREGISHRGHATMEEFKGSKKFGK